MAHIIRFLDRSRGKNFRSYAIVCDGDIAEWTILRRKATRLNKDLAETLADAAQMERIGLPQSDKNRRIEAVNG